MKTTGKSYGHVHQCQCGQLLFFDNSVCLRCGAAVAYQPNLGQVKSLELADGQNTGDEQWYIQGEDKNTRRSYARCANLHSPAQCNWLITDVRTGNLCTACALNITIPDLSQADNADYWQACEGAKRQLIAQLIMLGLPVNNRTIDPYRGLGFELLRWQQGEPPVMTGHEDGVITLDIMEADPAHREQLRQQMHEPYRTLLGHFRHESGHYYWDLLVQDTPWLSAYREFFGDERLDYSFALQQHYQNGPPANWQINYISSYAASHPWEDWAETWAHYLHMTDTLNAAAQFGINADTITIQTDAFTLDQIADCSFVRGNADDKTYAETFLQMVNDWVRLSSVLNVLARSMGQPDSYPFVLTVASLRKLFLVHGVVG
ncbi:MAG: putative zinc-binding metallopeptidase [Pseudohongiella sp.]|uniref:putative zinc-binding metallopeptidase n=1 Tax=Pseudohongiella sp. TaxID=1979412 RepID=UPI00349FF563